VRSLYCKLTETQEMVSDLDSELGLAVEKLSQIINGEVKQEDYYKIIEDVLFCLLDAKGGLY